MTTRGRLLALVATWGLGLLVPVTAHAADPELSEHLKPAIHDACEAGADASTVGPKLRTISAKAVRQAVLKYDKAAIPHSFDLDMGADAIATRAMDAPPDDAYDLWGRLAATWTGLDPVSDDYLPLKDGGILIERRQGKIQASDARLALRDILAGNDERFTFYCQWRSEDGDSGGGGDEKPKSFEVAWSLGQTPDDLTKSLSDREFGEISYDRDEVKNEETFSAHFTGGVTLTGSPRRVGRSMTLEPSVSAFVELETKDTEGDDSDVDNLGFGVLASGRLETRPPGHGATTLQHYYSFSLRHLTDTEFDSSAWSATLKLSPGLPLRGYGLEWGDQFRFFWDTTIVADYSDVEDPGEKAELLTIGQYSRVGYDLEGYVRWMLGKEEQAVRLGATYSLRDDFSDHRADAQLLQLKAAFEPTKRLSIGVVYDRGENLDSLEFGESWRLVLGIKLGE